MPQRQCTKTKAEVTSPCKRITLPISMEEYRELVGDSCTYRKWIDEMIVKHPELFPEEIAEGYTLHDQRTSVKLSEVQLRRICLKARTAEGKKACVYDCAEWGAALCGRLHRRSGKGFVFAAF